MRSVLGSSKFIFTLTSLLAIHHPLTLAANDLLPVTQKPVTEHPAVEIVQNQTSLATLCLMDAIPLPETMRAIEEFQLSMKLTFGTKLPVSRGAIPDGPAIIIGTCDQTRDAGIDGTQMPVEGFAIKTEPQRVYIAGHDDSRRHSYGTAWGIYEFLERFVGVRWYWPEQHGGRSVIPQADLVIPAVWIEDAPVFRHRYMYPPNPPGLPQLQAALRSANSWPVKLQVHAPFGWGKIEEIVTNRPEVFQLRSNGERDDTMLCYSNPRTLETYLEFIERHFDLGQPVHVQQELGIIGDSITVSPWDVAVTCHCDGCQKLWNPDGGMYGSASEILETFVARLGREVKRRWPDKTIIYLPYMNYTKPSGKVSFPGNVEVQVCGMPGLALYKEPAVWKEFQDIIDQWRDLTGRKVQTWEYSCWPEDRTKAPYHYTQTIQTYYQHNRDILVGSFINGNFDHWPRSNWSLYCWLKCLWNPDFDVDAAADAFCERIFGPAAKPMRELLALQIRQWEDSRFPDGTLSADAVYTTAFPPGIYHRMNALLAQAHEQASDDPITRQRLAYYETPFAAFRTEFEYVVEGKGMTPFIMKKAMQRPVLDGRLEEPDWQQAPKASFRRYSHAEQGSVEPNYTTTVQALWDTDGITFGFTMQEPSTTTLLKDNHNRDDGMLWWQDCVEIYLDPSGRNSGVFAQILITAGGAIYDAWNGDSTWTCEGLAFGIHVGEDAWCMEVFVPHAAIGAEVSTDSTGRIWYGQLTRNRMAGGRAQAEGSKLNAHQGGFNSNTGDFAEFRFQE